MVVRLSSDPSSVAAAIDQRLADVLQGVMALAAGIFIAFLFDYKMSILGLFMPSFVVSTQIYLTNALKRQLRQDAQATEEAARVGLITNFI